MSMQGTYQDQLNELYLIKCRLDTAYKRLQAAKEADSDSLYAASKQLTEGCLKHLKIAHQRLGDFINGDTTTDTKTS